LNAIMYFIECESQSFFKDQNSGIYHSRWIDSDLPERDLWIGITSG